MSKMLTFKRDWWPLNYNKAFLRFDVLAGLTAAAVVIPKAMAYATVAGLPVEIGLYTALVPMIIYAVLGTSRPLSLSTTSTIAILTAGTIAVVAPGGSTSELITVATTLALLVGVILVIASVFGLGFIANFISAPVLTGFKAGIGLVIVVDQLPKILGLHNIGKGYFLQDISEIVQHAPGFSRITLAVGLATLVFIIFLERFARRMPAPLLAVVLGIIASGLLGLAASGVRTVGMIPLGLPGFVMPDISLVARLWPAALGIALMSFIETIAAGRSFMQHGEPRPSANKELMAVGAANAAGAFFGIMPAGGGTSQTAINRTSGARTQMSEVVTAILVALTLLFLAPAIRLLPKATLAAVVIATTVVIISPLEFRNIRHIRKTEFRWAVVAFLGVLILGVLEGILVAVVASLLAMAYQANHPPVYVLGRKPGTDVFLPISDEHPEYETFPGLLIFRSEGRVHFANAERIGDKMWPIVYETNPRTVIFDCSATPDIEYTALKMLVDAEEKLREAGIKLWLAALNPEALKVINRSSLKKTIGDNGIFLSVEEAAEAYLAQK